MSSRVAPIRVVIAEDSPIASRWLETAIEADGGARLPAVEIPDSMPSMSDAGDGQPTWTAGG